MAYLNPAAEELYTVVTNSSSSAQFFSFLGRRGMTLGPSETVAIRGDLVATLGADSFIGRDSRRFRALERALKRGVLQILSLPAPIVYDNIGRKPLAVDADGGSLGAVDPDYTSSSHSL